MREAFPEIRPHRWAILDRDGKFGPDVPELLVHVGIVSEAHLLRLAKGYLQYYHTDRTHDGLEEDAPAKRPVTTKPSASARVVSAVRLGGLHHRYDWRQAA